MEMNKEYKWYKTQDSVRDVCALCVQAHGNTEVAGYGACPVLPSCQIAALTALLSGG